MLTSIQNPLVKQIRKLHRAKGRQQQQLCLLEGTHLLEVACTVDYPLVTVCCTLDWYSHHPQLWQEATGRSQRAEIVSPQVMRAIATTVRPDGVVATAKRLNRTAIELKTGLGLVLQAVRDPGNLGTIVRTAAAAGAKGLWLSDDSVDIDHPKVLRASAGEWFRLPVVVSPDLKTVIQTYRQQGTQIVATVPRSDVVYWEVDWCCPSLVLLGNEGAGLSEDLLQSADRRVTIPLSPGVESLNVAISAALILYEAQRQRQFSPMRSISTQ